MRQTRILRDCDFLDGAGNMAVDCAIAEAVGRREQGPTLRLYGWQPPCLSLGYGQRARDVDLAALHARGWELARRPTGGKAILHADELTYSLCLPLDHHLARGAVIESYRRFSVALLRALEITGFAATAEPRANPAAGSSASPVCFEAPSHYEICVGGRKLIGSAQSRRGGALLQHGSIPLAGDLGQICDVLAYDSCAQRESAKVQLRRRAMTVSEAKPGIARSSLAAALERGFAEIFETRFEAGSLSSAEAARAEQLRKERFGSREWTLKR